MKIQKLNELFSVEYGNKFDMNKMTPMPRKHGGINFVTRTGANNGICATVAPIPKVSPYACGAISVSLGGEKLLSAFVQESPFYTAQNVAVLIPREKFSFAEKIYVCLCIRHNRFRYSAFGREANRTLRELPVPKRECFPKWLASLNSKDVAENVAKSFEAIPNDKCDIEDLTSASVVSDLFEVRNGNSYELQNLLCDPNGVNFVSRRMGNNSVSAKVKHTSDLPFAAGSITVALSGNGVLETCVQPFPYYTGFHVAVLIPKLPMSIEYKMFCCASIKAHKFRYGFGRQANRTLPSLPIPQPPQWITQISMRTAIQAVAREVRNSFVDMQVR